LSALEFLVCQREYHIPNYFRIIQTTTIKNQKLNKDPSALHLAKSGYSNVQVFDYQPYDQNEYSTSDGADAASADLNKVMRMSYGNDILSQRLAFEAAAIWKQWNDEISKTPSSHLPKGLRPEDRLFENCGFLRLSADDKLSAHEETTLKGMTAEGLRDTQYIISNAEDEARAKQHLESFDLKFDVLKRRERGQNLTGVFGATAGFVRASKACVWTMHLARKAGVTFILGDKGRFETLLKSSGGSKMVGIKTTDGISHPAELVVVAGKLISAKS
jgi:sarcosine oxidase/L-pipecolate oxidase